MRFVLAILVAVVCATNALQPIDMFNAYKRTFLGMSVCDVCNEVMSSVEMMLSDEDIMLYATSMVMTSCEELPKNEVLKCKLNAPVAVAAFMDEAKMFEFDTVCDKICSGSPDASTCDILVDIQKALPEVVSALKQLCSDLPSTISPTCTKLVDQYVPKIANVINTVVTLVGKLMGCKNMNETAVGSPKQSIQCDACDDAISMLDFLLGSGLVDGSLKHLLDELCAKLPEPYADGCVSTVDGGMDQIIKYITDMTGHICPDALGCAQKKASPVVFDNVVCEAMQALYDAVPKFINDFEGVCDVLPAADVQGCKDFFKNEPQLVIQMAQEAVQWLASEIPFAHCNIHSTSTKATKSFECSACKDSMMVVNALLGSTLVAGELKTLLEGLCTKLPSPYNTGCQSTVDGGIDQIIKFIGDMDKHICTDALGCPASKFIEQVAVKPVQFQSIQCDACDDAISMLDFLLGSGLVDGSLKHLLEELCAKLPEPYADGCVSTVDGGMDQILKYITDMTGHICPDALGCAQKKMISQKAIFPRLSAASGICEVMQELYNAVPKFINDFEGICDVLPAADVQGCKDFFKNEPQLVIQMAQEAVQWLASEIPFEHCKISSV
jgi:hypothetical protein